MHDEENTAARREVENAGFWKRLAAFAIDLGLTSVIFLALVVILPVLLGPRLESLGGGVLLACGALLWFVTTWLYWAVMESSSKQSTLGKDTLGIVVTDDKGNRISFRRATTRYFGKILSALPALAGFVMVGFTSKKQGLHDLIAGSLVVKR